MRTISSCIKPVHPTDSTVIRPVPDRHLGALVSQPWRLRVGGESITLRPSTARDLAAVAQMHRRCSARSLLDRYRAGGRPPAVPALDLALRRPHSFVAARENGEVVATGTLEQDAVHNAFCVEIGLLVEDGWQRLGIGSALTSHLAGVAQVAGYQELIAYPATAVYAVQRLMIEVGRTRMVPDADAHLHTFLPDTATLGLGPVRQRLAG